MSVLPQVIGIIIFFAFIICFIFICCKNYSYNIYEENENTDNAKAQEKLTYLSKQLIQPIQHELKHVWGIQKEEPVPSAQSGGEEEGKERGRYTENCQASEKADKETEADA